MGKVWRLQTKFNALRALKAMHMPIDIVTGARMGSVVGGAYAAGRSVEEVEDFVRSTDWTPACWPTGPHAMR